jgi:putative inorganic carbon (hco3(-)) transporter
MIADARGAEHTQQPQLDDGPARYRLEPHIHWLLILSALALMPLEQAGYNTAIVVLGVAGLIVMIRTPGIFRDSRFQLFLALLACILLPMTVSLIGAAEPERSARTTAALLRFPFAAAFVIATLQHPIARRWLHVGVFIVAGVWTIDGLIQWQLGRNIFGFPYDGANLTGMFHPRRVIGLILAALLPVLLDLAWRMTRRQPALGVAAWLIVAAVPLVILLGGSRTSWMMLTVGILGWGIYRYVCSDWPKKTVVALAAIVMLAVAVPFVAKLPGMESRLEQTQQLFRGDYEAIDEATSGRLPIWEISIAMWRDHWLSGVGPRGFRYLYPDYADEDTPWISPDGATGASHPHQTVLEVLTEAGIIGLAGFALFWVLFVRAALRCGNEDAWPWILAVMLVFFPLNTHMAIYGSYWSHLSWLLVMIMAAMLSPKPPEPARS